MTYGEDAENTGQSQPISAWEWSSCYGKEQFSSAAKAKRAVKRIVRRASDRRYRGARLPSENLVAYRCDFCGSWHIGRWGAKR